MLVVFTSYYRPDAPPPQVASVILRGVALVGDHPFGAYPRSASLLSLYRSLFHQSLEVALLVALTGGDQEGDGLAFTFGAKVDLGRESSPASPEGLPFLRIFFWRLRPFVKGSPF